LGEPEHLVDGRYTEQELTLTMAAGHRRAAWRILPAWSILGERERGYTPVGELPSRWRRGRSAQLAEDIPRRSGSIRGCRWWPCANLPALHLLLKLGGGMAESTVSSRSGAGDLHTRGRHGRHVLFAPRSPSRLHADDGATT
jgi:hypothetical protein